ncbi:hypothetical protein ACIBH1_41425 [Nonomuraea sp. NPDC050663]|uniref:Amidotransferase n=1 Tax=Nonomuraea soli TaxID=1032476 RepID=A0A7W0CEM2_9ACTN|nr:hypothetical protein [Nonomuraea soli]MBA2889737.1 hypothetical protein [Nonomuraea soli]NUT42179.1 hypothetical protein [Thermoactinospora sp.]
MTDNWIAIAMTFIALFLIGGVVSMFKQGLKIGAVICGVLAAGAAVGAVLWW